jgi:hypothetical protein
MKVWELKRAMEGMDDSADVVIDIAGDGQDISVEPVGASCLLGVLVIDAEVDDDEDANGDDEDDVDDDDEEWDDDLDDEDDDDLDE